MKNSIRVRALLLVFVTLSLVLGANTLILSYGFASFQKNSYQNKALLLGEHMREELARAINLGLPIEALEGVNDSCRAVVDGNKEIGYCMFVNTQSRVLYHNDPLLSGRFLRDPASVRAAASPDVLVQSRLEDGVDYYDVSVPVFDAEMRRLGAIRLGLKYQSVAEQVYPLLWKAALVALVTFLLASALVTFQVTRKVVNPIVEMSAAAQLITHGDLSRRLNVVSKGEIGVLAQSLNQMAESLEEREERIQQGYSDLEKANSEIQASYRQLEATAGELELKSQHLKEHVGELSFLHDATDRLRSSIELDDILASVAKDVTEGLGYERIMVALINESTNTLDEKVSLGFDGVGREILSEPLDTHNIFSAAISERQVQYVAHASLDSRVHSTVVEALGLRECAVIPMVGKDRCVGALLIDNRKTQKPIRRNKLDMVAAFASTAAMVVENAYLYRQLMANLETVERANRELRQMDQTKTNFLSLASHELRTPLVSVMGYLNLMLSGDLGSVTAEQREMLEIAIKGASRLRDIIEDLLIVAKIEGGRLPLKLRWVSVSDVVGSSLYEVSPFIAQRRLNVHTEGLDSLPDIEADFDRLQQCFTNLIGNAIKFTPDGGRITISGRKVKVDKEHGKIKPVPLDNSILSSDNYVEITVSDTGIGIKRDNLEKIFEKFFEAGDVDSHSTGKGKFLGGGTGLGLSIVKGIAEAHNGRAWAESEGEDTERCPGSSFVMLLPMKQPAVKVDLSLLAAKESRPAAAAPSPVKPNGRKPRVLLVEDDDDTVVFTRLILEKKFDVTVAGDGFEGLRKAFMDRPDAVLLDVWMRGMDGYEVCRVLKDNEKTSVIPVAMFTAAAQKHEIENGFKAGADDYITKPLTPAELMSRVERLLNKTAGVA